MFRKMKLVVLAGLMSLFVATSASAQEPGWSWQVIATGEFASRNREHTHPPATLPTVPFLWEHHSSAVLPRLHAALGRQRSSKSRQLASRTLVVLCMSAVTWGGASGPPPPENGPHGAEAPSYEATAAEPANCTNDRAQWKNLQSFPGRDGSCTSLPCQKTIRSKRSLR